MSEPTMVAPLSCHGYYPCLTNAGRDRTARVICPGTGPIQCDCGAWVCWWCGDPCAPPVPQSAEAVPLP